MPGLANYQIPPPAKWEDFEDLCLDLWRKIWRDDGAQKDGRRGQPQQGVAIFGRPDGGATWVGVQCKGKNEKLSSTLTRKELLAEVDKAKVKPALSEWTIVSTGPRDASLQELARRLTATTRERGCSASRSGLGRTCPAAERPSRRGHSLPSLLSNPAAQGHTADACR